MYESAIIAEIIKNRAKALNIQLKNMLQELDLNKNTLSNMYKGSMLRADNLARIADYLNCSIDYLVGRSDSITIQKSESSPEDLLTIEKLHSLPKDSQDEILLLINYKYEQYQKKRKRLSSTSGSATTDDLHDRLA